MLSNGLAAKQNDSKSTFYTIAIIIGMLLIPIMAFTGAINIIIYHLTMEIIVISISFGIIMITVNTWNISQNQWFKYLGICFTALCLFVFLHAVFYIEKYALNGDIHDFKYVFDVYESTIRALAINIFVQFSYKGLEADRYHKILMLVPTAFIVFVFINKVPPIFVRGANPYNSIGLALIIALCCLNLQVLYLRREVIRKDIIINLGFSTIFAILTEVMVVLNIEYSNLSTILSHYCKVVSVYLLYRLIVTQVLSQPVQYLNQSILRKNSELEETVERLDAIRRDLSEKEKSYATIIENMPIAIVVRHGERIIFSNDTAFKMFKDKEGRKLIGESIFNLAHPDYLETARSNFEESNKDKIIVSSEGKLLNYENEIIDVEITIIPVAINNKRTHLMLIRDIADAKLSEKMKIELELAKENERLCTEFFANLSHEFRTPLNVIYTTCQLLEMYIKQNSLDKIEEYIKILKQNSYRMAKLANNIIDSSRISEDFYVISRSKVDFVRVVEDTVLSVVPYLEKNSVEVIFDTDVEEKFMLVDVEKIERIVLNLLSNAVKYRCSINSRIDVIIEDGEEEITLYVKDNGIGIPKEKQGNIFNRFNRVDMSLTRGEEGTGLGLYIVKSLVELHGGTINLISEENQGTEFIIKFPVVTCDKSETENKVIRTKTIDEKILIEFSDVYNLELE